MSTDQSKTQQTPQQGQPPAPEPTQQQQKHEEEDLETPLDYYETLGVKHGAGPATIDKAYRRQALRYHPQNYMGTNARANETRFAHISEAYQVLSDPDKRRDYDEYLKKNNDKFREFQKQHSQKQREEAKRWNQLPVLHFRFHPYSPFEELFGYRPMNPFEQFNQFLSHGLFDRDDLDFYGFNRPMLGFGHHGGFGSGFGGYGHGRGHLADDEFFGDREIRDFLRGNYGQQGQLHNHQEQPAQQPAQQTQPAQPAQQTQPAQHHPVMISKSITKHTKIENGVRTTITETKKVGADGNVDHQIKEETEDQYGNRRVRYLDALPDSKRKEITEHQSKPATQQSQAPSQEQKTAPETKDKTA